jgi:hypothetical protein
MYNKFQLQELTIKSVCNQGLQTLLRRFFMLEYEESNLWLSVEFVVCENTFIICTRNVTELFVYVN